MLLDATIIFPGLGIEIPNITSGFSLFGYYIAWYGLLIAIAIIAAVIVVMARARKTNQFVDDYIDITIVTVICAIVCARLYYVLFSLSDYSSLAQVLDVRSGGLAVYGGLIGGVVSGYVVCRIKKIPYLRVLDTCAPAFALAQCIGRWGNFFNLEAYGEYTESFFAMQIKYSQANGVISDTIKDNLVTVGETSYIQVHPTFLYESLACLLIFILILIFRRFQQYNGEIILWYVSGYALERAFVEGLRTDQLQIGSSGIAVSQLLSVALLAGAVAILIINRVRIATGLYSPDFKAVLGSGEPGTREFAQAKKEAKQAKKNAKWETHVVGEEKNEDEEEGFGEKATESETTSLEVVMQEDGPTLKESEQAISQEDEVENKKKEETFEG